MTKHMEIRNSVFSKLQEIKGEQSYSDVIESLLDKEYRKEEKKNAPVIACKQVTDATSNILELLACR